MERTKLTVESVHCHVQAFLVWTTELTAKAWSQYAVAALAPSSGTVVNYLGRGKTFSRLICDIALEEAPPEKIYLWPLCPQGRQHQVFDRHRGAVGDYLEAKCGTCVGQNARRMEWIESLPMFKDQHPQLVPYLDDASLAFTRGEFVSFSCHICQARGIKWSSKGGDLPTCPRCIATGGTSIGHVISRRGGGDYVKLDARIAAELREIGLDARNDLGIVVPNNAYYLHVIKPDIVIQPPRIAIEIDNSNSYQWENRHLTPEGESDDRLRDYLLKEIGWKVLRIRRPDAPSDNQWPWQIQTTSIAPKKLARMIYDELSIR